MKYFFSPESITNIIENSENDLKLYKLDSSCHLIKNKIMNLVSCKASDIGLSCEKFFSVIDYDILACVYVKSKNYMVYDAEFFDVPSVTKTFDIDKPCKYDNFVKELSRLNSQKKAALNFCERNKHNAMRFYSQSDQLISKYISKPKILNYILRFIQRNKIPQLSNAGKLQIRNISCITAWGVHSFYETILESCNNIFTVSGNIPCINNLLISGLCEAFIQCGYDVIAFKCSLTDKLEHICIPALSLAFMYDNDYHFLPYGEAGNISCERFLKAKIPDSIALQTLINSEKADDFIGRAVFSAYDALEIQNRISDILYNRCEDYFSSELINLIALEISGNN